LTFDTSCHYLKMVNCVLTEGSGKRTPQDQARFYSMALGSLRECEAILALEQVDDPALKNLGDQLGAIFYTLSHRLNRTGNSTEHRTETETATETGTDS